MAWSPPTEKTNLLSLQLMSTEGQAMRNLEPLPNVEEIYRDELGLDESIAKDFKARLKSFKRAYVQVSGVKLTSNPMMRSDSTEMKVMAEKFLEEGIAADPRVPAAKTFWEPGRGSLLEHPKDRGRILAGTGRLLARQGRYLTRNVKTRGVQQLNEAGDVLPVAEDPDMPDVDEILQAKGLAQAKNKEGEVPQTRSGRPYNHELPVSDISSSEADVEPIQCVAPVATMTQGLNWHRPGGVDSKPLKDLTCEKTKPDTSAKATMVGQDLPAEQLLPRTTSMNSMEHAYVTNRNEDYDNVNSFNQDLALAKPLAAAVNVPQFEVDGIIEDAMPVLDAKQPESEGQDKSAGPGKPTSKDRILKSNLSRKRNRPEPVESSHDLASDETIQSTEGRTFGGEEFTVGEKPNVVDEISNAHKVRKPQDDRTQINNKPTSPRRNGLTPAQVTDSTIPSLHSGNAPSEAHVSDPAADVQSPLSKRRKGASGNCTKPSLGSRKLLPKQKSARKSPPLTRQAIRAHTVPLSLDGMVAEEPNASHENANIGQRESATSTMDIQGPHLEVSQTTGTEDSIRGRGHRETSRTLEPEPPIGRAELEQSPPQGNEAAAPARRPRITGRLWILKARVPKIDWTHWANASLSALTVSTMFQAIDQFSHFKHVETANVKLEINGENWTYQVRKDDPDQFDDMKTLVLADIRATLSNWDINNVFKICIEPVGGEETVDDATMKEAEDEIFSRI